MKLRVLSDYPAIVVLFIWMLGPLIATIYYSLIRYNLLNPRIKGFAGIENYEFLLTDFVFTDSIYNSIQLLGSIIGITVVLGLLISYLLDQDLYGGRLLQLVIISPFFVMPTVSALIWKNLLMHPVNGYFTYLLGLFGLPPIDWFSDIPLGSIIIIVSWNWLPFAVLVFVTAQQSMSLEIKEASKMDGAGHIAFFFQIYLPHLGKAIGAVVMIQMIFHLNIFAEIFTTTTGGPGTQTTNLAFLVYRKALLDFDIGGASAGGIISIVFANIVAIFLLRMIAKNMNSD
ncbi:MAG: carbohydrate ABC transporter permease [bacterium]|jgi:sorbitol/mannitol transport system permease protein